MAFDVFDLRERVVGEYRDYVESFVRILDPDIDAFVRDTLAAGELWPDAVLQLNPAYEEGGVLQELANRGVVARETARFFGGHLRLHRHQQEALAIAQRGEPCLVSTGTGSGKSLTYLLPIVDHVFRHAPAQPGVRAIVVYPMNALINSQIEALREFPRRNWPDTPLRFASYTGQDKDEQRQAIIDNPPHILLTNYVMLEYMLLRPFERTLVKQATGNLRFLVLDELHVYRGRQGADVAMLTRRLRQRAGGQPQIIGTSATIASRGDRDERRAAIAQVGSTLFGVPIPRENVVDETLRRVAATPAPQGRAALRAAVESPPPAAHLDAVRAHPLAAWVEETFGLTTEDDRLVRRPPISFNDGLRRLVEETGLPEALCAERLRAMLDAGNTVRLPDSDEPLFAFRLHQFLSSGSSVYATLDAPDRRRLTTEGQVVLPESGTTRPGGESGRLLYPLAFCRDCGQEHYLVSLFDEGGDARFIARSPLVNAPEIDTPGVSGFLVLDPVETGHEDDPDARLWAGREEELPEFWMEERKAGPKPKSNYKRFIPRELWVGPDGKPTAPASAEAVRAWWMPRPLMLCLRCRAAYDLRDKSDFRKLATLSQTGRSTATTVLTYSTIGALRAANPQEAQANKVLSFTDNRQDASLQAGHLNDFAQVTMMRGALARALTDQRELRFSEVGSRILAALDPNPEDFMREPTARNPGNQMARAALTDLLTYRAFEDLRRAWRVAQPNLEQAGRLRITYHGLAELAAEDHLWADLPAIGEVAADRRCAVLTALLDHLRGQLIIDADSLKADQTHSLIQQVNQWLRAPWTIDRSERLRTSMVARLPGVARQPDDLSSVGMGVNSTIGRYLRFPHAWELEGRGKLSAAELDDLVRGIVRALTGHLFTEVQRSGEPFGFQLKADAIRWTLGDGTAPLLDPVRSRAAHQRRLEMLSPEPNPFFDRLYGTASERLAGIVGAEHTGQVSNDDRIDRERRFREGTLPALFCSPTMELGVDIRTLNVVHMRNVPPTPANYAQRSGRAGRGGRPALVLAFASQGNAHDTYFFRRTERMISGTVAPARMDLGNRELVQAHLQSVWLAATGVSLGRAADAVLDLDDPDRPLLEEARANLTMNEIKRAEVVAAFREITAADPVITTAPWFDDAWLRETVDHAVAAFDRAFDRWRELYRAALRQRDEARRKIDRPRLKRQEREQAERMEREAKRDIDLLLNQGDATETDFYPYRYLATEGFLPGYNFPRLPLR
ncbi:MAG: DEAD/DEAH box helicase, partial [Thermomicrobiales bacterium]|nr:DEAD/DEAH box helicase [Thermomicrobiales bacterium]